MSIKHLVSLMSIQEAVFFSKLIIACYLKTLAQSCKQDFPNKFKRH